MSNKSVVTMHFSEIPLNLHPESAESKSDSNILNESSRQSHHLNAITGSSMSIVKKSDNEYLLKVEFVNESGLQERSVEIEFSKTMPCKKGLLLDVYSFNCIGYERDFLSKDEYIPFSTQDLKNLKSVGKKYQNMNTKTCQTITVLDVKDTNKEYKNITEIQAIEKKIINLLKLNNINSNVSTANSQITNKIHKILRNLKLDYLICEGSLKYDILKDYFTEREKEYFCSSQGSIAICQIAEVFMNGFKTGYQNPAIKDTSKYIVPISNLKSFQPSSQNWIWYPKNYKVIYSTSGNFYRMMNPIYKIQGDYDSKADLLAISIESQLN